MTALSGKILTNQLVIVLLIVSKLGYYLASDLTGIPCLALLQTMRRPYSLEPDLSRKRRG